LQQLLDRGVRVRALVRSTAKLPPAVVGHPGLTVIEASPLALADDELRRYLLGCDAVVSCLGHTLGFRGVFGAPRDLVTRATTRLCRAIEALAPDVPVKVVLMTSVSVHRPRPLDARRGRFDRACLWLLRGVLPPARDNQRAADFLRRTIGTAHPSIEWVVVRPDSLQEGDVSAYALHEGLVHSLFSPGHTRMANVAHFICELVTEPSVWAAWQRKLPVIVDAAAPRQAA
jgi:hypothetical protein